MGLFRKLGFVFFLVMGTANVVSSQQSDVASVEGKANILDPIGIVNVDAQGLNFGSLAIGQVASKVVIEPVEPLSIQVEEGDTKILINLPQSPAKFQVTGETGRVYKITLPTSMVVNNGTDDLLIDHFTTSVLNNSGIISSNTIFYVGARLNIPTNKPLGNYSGSFDIEVAYE